MLDTMCTLSKIWEAKIIALMIAGAVDLSNRHFLPAINHQSSISEQ